MDFIKYLQSQVNLPHHAVQQFGEAVRRKTYAKRTLILPVDNTSKQLYFIEQGTARVFYARQGKDVTLHFLTENKIGLPIDSIFYNQLCRFGIEALTETTVATTNYAYWEALVKKEMAMQQLTQRMMVEYIKKATDRIYYLKFQTPVERYKAMLAEFPGIDLHVPLGHIASYLGITLETLSRIRARRI